MKASETAGTKRSASAGTWRLPERLPQLSGRWLAAFSVLWAAVLVAAWITPAGTVLLAEADFRDNWVPFETVGLVPIRSTPEGVVLWHPLGSEAISSGVRQRDMLVSVNGRPARTKEEAAPLLRGPEGSRVLVRTRSPDGTIHDHLLTRSPRHVAEAYAGSGLTPRWQLRIMAGAGILDSLVLILAAGLLFRRRPSDPVAAALSFSFLCIAAAVGPPLAFFFYTGLAPLGVVLNVAGLLLLILVLVVFPEGRFSPRWTRWMVPALIAFAPVSYSGWLGQSEKLITLPLCLVAIYSILYRYRRLPEGPQRQQIRWVSLGFIALVLFTGLSAMLGVPIQQVSGLTTRTFLWLQTASAILFCLGLASVALGFLVSLLRYRLYDADAAISRSVAYGALTLMLVAVFAGTEKVIELLGEDYFGESLGALAGGLGAALAAAMIVPLHHRVGRWAERRFQKQLIRLRHGLPLLVADLRETAGLERIGAAVLEAVTQGVRASRSALLVGDAMATLRGCDAEEVEGWRTAWSPASSDGLDCDRRDALFPMRVPLHADGHGRVGWLLLGPRPDGSFYGRDEREALAEIAEPVARAVQIVSVRVAREQEGEHWRRGQEERVARLEAAIARLLDGGGAAASAPVG